MLRDQFGNLKQSFKNEEMNESKQPATTTVEDFETRQTSGLPQTANLKSYMKDSSKSPILTLNVVSTCSKFLVSHIPPHNVPKYSDQKSRNQFDA